MNQPIRFLMTGGTIDAFYDPVHQTARPRALSGIPAYLDEIIQPYTHSTAFEQICMKDSKELDDNDRQNLLQAAKDAPERHIIITHGTDTMPVTAQFLKDNLGAQSNKTIVMTGSMVPLQGFDRSDSGFNLGYAIARIESLAPGVYICMNATMFEAGNVRKNFEKARFEAIE